MTDYLMESAAETRRLLAQEREDPADLWLSRSALPKGARALDVGCGPGLITLKMAARVGPLGEVVGVDQSEERIAAAKAAAAGAAAGAANVRFEVARVQALPFADGAFDYVASQFLFQYLPDRPAALAELVRVARPGGKVVISEVDGAGLCAWPMPAELEGGLRAVLGALASTGYDAFVGRKVFSEMVAAGLKEVRVHLLPHYVIAGAADGRMIEDWRVRLATLRPLGVAALGKEQAYDAVVSDYLALLEDPAALKYSVLLVTEGLRA